MSQPAETYADQILNFSLPERSARGRAVRLDGVLNEILSAHDYPAPIAHVLGEALVLTSLMGGLLKEENAQLTMQAQTQNGPIRLLVCDYRDAELRGYVDYDQAERESLGASSDLMTLFGQGHLAITFETGAGKRYQGIVPLEGASLSDACQNYFFQSEQIPTLIRVGVRSSDQGCEAGGLLVQHLADGEQGRERLHVRLDHPDWEHVSVLASTLSHDELVDRGLSMEALIWRLFHEEGEILTEKGGKLTRGCRCSVEHYGKVLSKFPAGELDAMRNDAGVIVVDCAFCSREFAVAN